MVNSMHGVVGIMKAKYLLAGKYTPYKMSCNKNYNLYTKYTTLHVTLHTSQVEQYLP